ncbi:hypothetical protein EV421DRAFT_1736588 [Armillaria borealis]|uniref:Uncharacterized protein n=1 Tax=Armillaria borealis TaxID=47425 RepID=A0AA39JG24_9AGAR|nr:hypothetical protein EV421DRAFT_1736588 [Armillaria borealis]
MTTDLNVLRAGKPHIYDVKTRFLRTTPSAYLSGTAAAREKKFDIIASPTIANSSPTQLVSGIESEEEVVVLKGTQVKRVNRHGRPSRVFKARRIHLSKSLPDDSSGKRLAMKRLRRGPGQPDNRPFV